MQIKYEISHFNPIHNRMQYNTFHKKTLEETIAMFKQKGYDISNIKAIRKKTCENIEVNHSILNL